MQNNMDIIYCCLITDRSENAGLVVELLSALGLQFSSWQDRETKLSRHTIYCESKSEAQNVKAQLEEAQPFWKELGADVTDIETTSIKREDWSETWKKYFHVIEISDRLVIKPSWEDYDASPKQVIVEIDPGMSFGTGQHATTSFCLKMLDKLADGTPKSFLDAGCGSGILSIAANKLGYNPMSAFDIDPDATRIAQENFEFNAIPDDSIELTTADLAGFKTDLQYDLVAANILAHILVKNREIIYSFVKPAGNLILAGILNEEFDKISSAFCELGLKQIESFSEKEWTSGLFVKEN